MLEKPNEADWTLFGAIGAGLAAAACCLGPFLLVSVGVTGAWIGNLSALEAYRPLFLLVAAGLLGYGFYRQYGTPNTGECGGEEECETPRATTINRMSLWVATVVVLGLFASPYFLTAGIDSATAQNDDYSVASSEKVSGDDTEKGKLATVTLGVDGMTCGGCVKSVESALKNKEGVQGVQVTLEPPQARVTYDPASINAAKLTKTTQKIGYPSKVQTVSR